MDGVANPSCSSFSGAAGTGFGTLSAVLQYVRGTDPMTGVSRSRRSVLGHGREHALLFWSDKHVDGLLHALYVPASAHRVVAGRINRPSYQPGGNRSVGDQLLMPSRYSGVSCADQSPPEKRPVVQPMAHPPQRDVRNAARSDYPSV